MNTSSGIEPVRSSAQNSRACGEVMSSNCVKWGGGAQVGNVEVCEDWSLTDVITAMGNQCCSANTVSPCYTGAWVDFASSIVPAGSGSTYSYSIGTFGIGNTGNPSYKWTAEGNLALKGGFVLDVNTSIPKEYIDIPLLTLSPTCFPNAWSKNQGVVTFVDFFISNQVTISLRGVVYLDRPTGILYLNFTFANILLLPMRAEIDLGGVLFNLG